jgi:signal transduction histidine kinase
VQDDGGGFDPETASHGFGLAGMQERVSLAGGTLSVDSGERGTMLSARLPAHRREAAGGDGA